MSDIPDRSSEPDPAAEPVQQPRRNQRQVLLILAIVGVLLTGFLGGILVDNAMRTAPETPGAVDVGFSQDMSVHHTQAVQMAGVTLSGSTDPAVKRLAYDILTTQANQAGRMQGWLQEWNEPLIAPDGYMGWMTDMSSHQHSGTAMHSGAVQAMPGMASDQEMAELGKATGTALDTLFLQLMLRHHQGGMPMIEYAAQRADTDAVRTLAQSMAKTQQGEADLMTQMLAERKVAPLPMN
ncbi:DUF305 domain-containing protein [Nocardia seriolae]|nr:DUF305 domain-containing protein [Nocardia seriolae]APB01240.1 hypothetical protein NS506_07218 [Nocardia seriolae]MTJ61257.1 DUF305 domain-containing protein [Nocardia seriolae]MTJ70014.1 DUF305 domain-containing protein [Nocardia seriolae]MTJ90618.1 DUF305 domain-containing protein [Nocardia seriolae]MTK34579.1 DUF305 domain-containing protein [Nocardia seriolae]